MKYLLDFVQQQDITKTLVYKSIKCKPEEAMILKFICLGYINGTNEFNVSEVLIEIFGNEKYLHIKKLPLIRNLIDSGWIIISSFSSPKSTELSNLEILHTQISLSSPFLKILEDGNNEIQIPEALPYKDQLEYLKDEFLLIELYHKLSLAKQNTNLQSPNVKGIEKKIQVLESRIDERLAISEVEIPLENLFIEHSLNKKEKIIFLTLLKEEYNTDVESIRELGALISLVSKDEFEKIKNRALLEESSKLIENGLIDYDEILTAFGGMSRSFYINEDILQKIMHPEIDKKSKKIKLDMLVEKQDIFEIIEPKTTLDDVVMNDKTRELLENLLKQVDKTVIARLRAWGIKKNRRGIDAKIILYGPPGTGKTMTAVSLAKSLKKRLLSFDCSKILSKYVGESEQNVRKIFDTYKEICKTSKTEPVLLLNEADQFLSSRSEDNSSGSEKMHNQMQNIFLEQIEKFEGVLIATTNFLSSLDKAFSRRFDYKIEFLKPDYKERLELWRRILPESAVYEKNFSIEELAKFELSGGQIVLVLKNTALKVAVKKEAIFTMQDFYGVIERESNSAFDKLKKVGFST